MLYFFVLREENDIDVKLSQGTLYDHIEGLEKQQIEACIKTYEERGLDTRELRARLEILNSEGEQ